MPAYTLWVRAADKVCPVRENACIHLMGQSCCDKVCPVRENACIHLTGQGQ
ncbi:hypothetical protein DPMN_104303 [Dreissena polymorpha]|uniref:Uncharacterized protein n=1 Tax=Dreissena polymorpha TaxID=45954 RepID=A0A9D4HBQ6_DREPO|nr:hypothetical protein DPMN_104303 [Dreissena polymorpha]